MAEASVVKVQTADSASANQRAIRATIIGIKKQVGTVEPGESKALPEDPFEALSAAGRIIEPPFDMLTLAMLEEHNTELRPCLDAMATNIDGFGHRFVPRLKGPSEELPPKVKNAMKQEWVRLQNFFAYANIEDSFGQLREKLRRDLEATGNGYWEVIRNAAGKVQGFTHLPSYQMRIGRQEEKPVRVKVPILELQLDGSIRVESVATWQRFRPFAQSRAVQMRNLSYLGGYKLRWFKSFGDPRVMDNETGELVKDKEKVAKMPESRKANEVVHFKLYSPRSPYGLPRYIGNLLSIFGDRASEEINYITFKNNNIPSMMLLVSNGQLTEGSIQRIESFVESQIQGSDNYSKFLLLEAESEDMEGEDSGHVKIDAKPLVETQHKDALFQKYSANNKENVRRAFRLPPIFVGKSDDYTRSTAETSRRLADEQVFAPQRDNFDDWVNRRLFPEMAIIYHKFKSNSPNTTDNEQLVKILAGAEKTGGMTPRIARKLLEDILGQELPDFPKGFDPDSPFSLAMAEAVKNKADPSEPGQQVTALKLIDQLTKPDIELDDGVLAEHALRLNRMLEKRWRDEVHAVTLGTLDLELE